MTFGQEIEYMRQKRGYSIVDMCNTLMITETEYSRLIIGRYSLDNVKKVLLIAAMCHPFDSMSQS